MDGKPPVPLVDDGRYQALCEARDEYKFMYLQKNSEFDKLQEDYQKLLLNKPKCDAEYRALEAQVASLQDELKRSQSSSQNWKVLYEKAQCSMQPVQPDVQTIEALQEEVKVSGKWKLDFNQLKIQYDNQKKELEDLKSKSIPIVEGRALEAQVASLEDQLRVSNENYSTLMKQFQDARELEVEINELADVLPFITVENSAEEEVLRLSIEQTRMQYKHFEDLHGKVHDQFQLHIRRGIETRIVKEKLDKLRSKLMNYGRPNATIKIENLEEEKDCMAIQNGVMDTQPEETPSVQPKVEPVDAKESSSSSPPVIMSPRRALRSAGILAENTLPQTKKKMRRRGKNKKENGSSVNDSSTCDRGSPQERKTAIGRPRGRKRNEATTSEQGPPPRTLRPRRD